LKAGVLSTGWHGGIGRGVHGGQLNPSAAFSVVTTMRLVWVLAATHWTDSNWTGLVAGKPRPYLARRAHASTVWGKPHRGSRGYCQPPQTNKKQKAAAVARRRASSSAALILSADRDHLFRWNGP